MNSLNMYERSGTLVPKVQNRQRSLHAALLMFKKKTFLPGFAGYDSRPPTLLATRAMRGTWKDTLQYA